MNTIKNRRDKMNKEQVFEAVKVAYKALDDKNPLKSEMENYTHGARCTFPGFKCSSDCHYLPGKRLIRKI